MENNFLQKIMSFPISIINSSLEPVDKDLTLTKCRVSIFYKDKNRNGGYITDEFAEKLIQSLAYTPIKGIYNTEEQDYEGHGEKREDGKIYGIIPENFNFSWEERTDEDGITRTYACSDCYLFSGLYPNISQVIGKSLSMELYPPSIKGDFIKIDGSVYYKYTDGQFLGIQILGNSVEPCFEGASFYNLNNNDILKYVVLANKIWCKGGNSLEKQISNVQLNKEHFNSINSELDTINYVIVNEMPNNYVITYNLSKDIYEKFTYNENNELVLSDEKIFNIFLSNQDNTALKNLQDMFNLSTVNDIFEYVKQLTEQVQQQEELKNQIQALTTQNEDLTNYKQAQLQKEKNELLNQYKDKLPLEIFNMVQEQSNELTLVDLEKELAYELIKSNKNVFFSKDKELYTPNNTEDDIINLLNKYNRKEV